MNISKPLTKKIGFILRQAPYGSNLAQEALEALLATANYGQQLSIFFIGDGVFQLLKDQQPNPMQGKSMAKQLASFDLYDLENVYVCRQSLTDRQLNTKNLVLAAKVLGANELSQLMRQQNTLLSF